MVTGAQDDSGPPRGAVVLLLVAGALGLAVAWILSGLGGGGADPSLREPLAVVRQVDDSTTRLELGLIDELMLASDLAPDAEAVVRREDVAAAGESPLSDEELAAVRQAIDAMRDDDIRWNGLAARRLLIQFGEPARHELERALESADLQQRVFAADVLRRLGGPPSARLVEISIQQMGQQLPRRYHRSTEVTRYLARHTQVAAGQLRRALQTGDEQVQLLAAFLLSRQGLYDAASPVILMKHLSDNRIAGDAVMAAHGLRNLGRDVTWMLWNSLPTADEQAKVLVAAILRDIDYAERAGQPIEGGGRWLTALYHDPAEDYDVFRSRVPSW